MTNIINGLACRAWLKYLAQGKVRALLGELNNDLLTVGDMYSIAHAYVDYYAEVPLLGRPGVDLSAQYCLADFVEQNSLTHPNVKAQGDLLHRYAKLLQCHLPQVLSDCHCFLETDTASGNKEQSSLFFNMTGNLANRLATETVSWVGSEEQLKAVKDILQLVQAELSLWHLGFMLSRNAAPIRLVFLPNGFRGEDILKALTKLGKSRQVEIIKPLLSDLEKYQLFDFILDIDILADGTVGNTIGLELLLKSVTPTQQLLTFRTPAWRQTLGLLQQQGKADNRIRSIESCVFSKLAPDKYQKPYYMYSRFSHYKLSWHKEEQLATKAYLHLKTSEVQKNINEINLTKIISK